MGLKLCYYLIKELAVIPIKSNNNTVFSLESQYIMSRVVDSFDGYARVVRLDLKMKTPNVLHVLTKRPLSTIDIHLFNEPRAVTYESCN